MFPFFLNINIHLYRE